MTSDETSVVRSPYDGSVVGAVPALHHRATSTGDRRRAANATAAAPCPRTSGPRSSTGPPSLLAERNEEFARSISAESAKPITTARVEATRAVDTFRFSAAVGPHAHRRDGRRSTRASAGVGKLGFVLRVPIGVVGAISPFNFPLNLVCHKIAPGHRRRLPGGAQAGVGHAADRAEASRALFDECGLPPGWLNVVTCAGLGRQPPGRARRRRHDHLHRLAPRSGWGIRARAPRKRVGARARQQRPGDHRARRRLGRRRRQDRGRRVLLRRPDRASRCSGSTCTAAIHDEFVAALAEQGRGARRRRPGRRRHRGQRADPAQGDRAGRSVDRRGRRPRAPRSSPAATATDRRRAAPDGARRRHARHGGVHAPRCSGPVVGVAAYDDFDEALDLANDTRYGLQAGGVHAGPRHGAARAATHSTSAACSSTRCPRGAPTRCPTAASATPATPVRARRTRSQEMTERRMVIIQG